MLAAMLWSERPLGSASIAAYKITDFLTLRWLPKEEVVSLVSVACRPAGGGPTL